MADSPKRSYYRHYFDLNESGILFDLKRMLMNLNLQKR